MNYGTDGEFPEIERRMTVAGRVLGVKRALPLDHLVPGRLLGWAVLLTYRLERRFGGEG